MLVVYDIFQIRLTVESSHCVCTPDWVCTGVVTVVGHITYSILGQDRVYQIHTQIV